MGLSLHVGTAPGSLVDLSGASYGCTLLRGPVSVMAGPRNSKVGVPGRDGGVVSGGYLETTDVGMELWVQGTSWSNLLSKLDELKYVLRPEQGLLWWKTDQQSDRMRRGVLDAALDAPAVGTTGMVVPVKVHCADPLMYGVTEEELVTAVAADPTTFVVDTVDAVSVAIGGTAYAAPVWVIKLTTVTGPVILTNLTTGEVFTSATGITGRWLRLNQQPASGQAHVEESTDSGANWVSAMLRAGDGVLIPKLKPRVVNSMRLTGVTSGEVVCTWRARWL